MWSSATSRARGDDHFFVAEGCNQKMAFECHRTEPGHHRSGGTSGIFCVPSLGSPPAFANDEAELFDCLTPDACPASLEERARRRAATNWTCSMETIAATQRPTSGLSVVGSQMLLSAQGRAELHVQPGVKGGVAFSLVGCGRSGVLACVPAHRTVVTASATYDNTDDRVCLWARD
jgi:hypothetical protein